MKLATKNDIPLLQQLAKESWESAYKNILEPDQIDYMLENMYGDEELKYQFDNELYRYYLIFDGEIPVGFIGYELHYETQTTKLHRIYLIEAAKGKGLGKKALSFMVAQVRISGDHRVILNVNKNNIAREIYEKFGFKVYGEGVFDIGNGYVMDDYLMEYFV